MTASEAFRILGVPTTATAADAKKAYRAMSRKFHPDVNPAPDAAARFIEVAAAYEIVRKILAQGRPAASEEEELDEELYSRLRAIRTAIRILREDIDRKLHESADDVVRIVVHRAGQMGSVGRLRRELEHVFRSAVLERLNALREHVNGSLRSVCADYEHWVSSIVRQTCEEARRAAAARRHSSIGFWAFAAVVAAFVATTLAATISTPVPTWALAAGCLGAGYVFARAAHALMLVARFSPRRHEVRLDAAKVQVDSGALRIDFGDAWSDSASSGMGAVAGGGIGLLVGGPMVAVVGAVAGSLVGAFFGESFEEAYQKAAEQMDAAMNAVLRSFHAALQEELSRIEAELVSQVRANYQANRKAAVQLLLAAPKHERESRKATAGGRR